MKIKTIHGQPALDVSISDTTDKSSPNFGKEYVVNRDRFLDADWVN